MKNTPYSQFINKLEKSHKYISRWLKNGKWEYEYPVNQRGVTSKKKAKSEIVKKTSVITGIKPLVNPTETDVKRELDRLKALSNKGVLRCHALGNANILIDTMTETHVKKTHERERTEEAYQNKVKYLPFVEEILKYGKLTEKSYRPNEKEKHKKLTYGVACRVEFRNKDGKNVSKSIELAIAFNKEKQKYILSFADADIKKALSENNAFPPLCTTMNCIKNNHFAEGFATSDKKDFLFASDKTILQKAHAVNDKPVSINIQNITVGNRIQKYEMLEKCLCGQCVEKIPADDTKKLGNVTIRLSNKSPARIEKALRSVAFSLDVPMKSAKGEAFSYKAQEDLTDNWCIFFSQTVRDTYDFVIEYFGLPKITVMSKAFLTHKGKVLYAPETGAPIQQKEWEKFVKNLEIFLNHKTKSAANRIILDSVSLGKILDRMLQTHSFEAVKKIRLENLKYKNKTFDWITDNIKNMKNVFGDSLTRAEQARIQVLAQSAAQRITKCSDAMKADIQQILIDGVKNRSGKSKISQSLFDKMVGSNRDFQRIADTEIQNSVNHSFLQEEVYNAKDGEKIYFQRLEIIDGNTCPFCHKMNGAIALWSETPLASDKIKDEYASVALWDGKDWDGTKNMTATGVFHPYCRGVWVRWNPTTAKKGGIK